LAERGIRCRGRNLSVPVPGGLASDPIPAASVDEVSKLACCENEASHRRVPWRLACWLRPWGHAAASKAPEATSGVEAATSPWWKEPDGVLARFAAMPPLCAKLLFD
jgi:hypothetical protein